MAISTRQKQNPVRAERLEARISIAQKTLFQHAAKLLGRSLTDFVISSLQETAAKVIQENEILQLSKRDQVLFVKSICNAPAPNKNLIKAAKRHRKMTGE